MAFGWHKSAWLRWLGVCIEATQGHMYSIYGIGDALM